MIGKFAQKTEGPAAVEGTEGRERSRAERRQAQACERVSAGGRSEALTRPSTVLRDEVLSEERSFDEAPIISDIAAKA